MTDLRHRLAAFVEAFTTAPSAARRAGLYTIGVLAPLWVFFSVAHLLQTRGYVDSYLWKISTDGGYAEYFEYALLALSAAAFALLFIRSREALYAVIAAILAYLALDDATSLHEKAGALYSDAGLPTPLARLIPSHFGELLYLAVIGAILIGLIVLTASSASREARHAGLTIALLVFGIGFFSAGVDTVHSFTHVSQLGFIEDCGEILMFVLIAAFSVFMIGKEHHTSDDARP